MSLVYSLGRIFIPVLFIVSGFNKFANVAGISKSLAAKNIPVPVQLEAWTGMPKYDALGYLVGAVEVVFGLLVLVGWQARFAAVVLLLFTVATIFTAHDFWNMEGAAVAANLTQALKNLSIIGGLLLIVGAGSGSLSVDGPGKSA